MVKLEVTCRGSSSIFSMWALLIMFSLLWTFLYTLHCVWNLRARQPSLCHRSSVLNEWMKYIQIAKDKGSGNLVWQTRVTRSVNTPHLGPQWEEVLTRAAFTVYSSNEWSSNKTETGSQAVKSALVLLCLTCYSVFAALATCYSIFATLPVFLAFLDLVILLLLPTGYSIMWLPQTAHRSGQSCVNFFVHFVPGTRIWKGCEVGLFYRRCALEKDHSI